MAKPEDAARWIALESDDYDALGGSEGYGWARATTDDVAAGIGVSTEEAYRLLKAAARKDLVTQDKERRKGVHTKRFGASQVGWAIWEVHLTREQALKRHNEEDFRRLYEPNAKAKGGGSPGHNFFRVQPSGLGIVGHRSMASSDEEMPGIDVFLEPSEVARSDAFQAVMPSFQEEWPAEEVLVLFGADDYWDNEDAEGVRVDPESVKILARVPFERWVEVNEGADWGDEEAAAAAVTDLVAEFPEPRERRARKEALRYRQSIARSGDDLKPNASYYVWVLAPRSDTPLASEGPYGPHPLRAAEQMARIGAQEGIHDRAVSRGRDPEARGFKIERRYAARSGTRLV